MAAWRELAAGPRVVPRPPSGFRRYLALLTLMSPVDRTAVDTEQVWWTAAFAAGLLPGALAGGGDFAAALPEEVWLPLAPGSAAHTPERRRPGRRTRRRVPARTRRPAPGRAPARPPRP